MRLANRARVPMNLSSSLSPIAVDRYLADSWPPIEYRTAKCKTYRRALDFLLMVTPHVLRDIDKPAGAPKIPQRIDNPFLQQLSINDHLYVP